MGEDLRVGASQRSNEAALVGAVVQQGYLVSVRFCDELPTLV